MDKHNKSMRQTEKEGACISCVMNTICTFSQKEQKGRAGYCPSSVKHLPVKHLPVKHLPIIKSPISSIKKKTKKKEPADMIPVIKMEYWDGSKFIIRKDKAGYKKIICKLRVKMRSKFLDLSIEEQVEAARLGGMLKKTEEMMSEVAYLKIKKG